MKVNKSSLHTIVIKLSYCFEQLEIRTAYTALEKSSSLEFTYSTPDDPFGRRALIKAIETLGGQRKLKKLYLQFLHSQSDKNDFFDSAIKLLDLRINFDEKVLESIPKTGPVVFIANHPYGVLDGIALTWLARKARPDVKVMANHILCKAPDTKDTLLPVDFSKSHEALKTNIKTRSTAIETLKNGGAIGIFPAGGVAVSEKPYKGPALDTAWHPFAAKIVKTTDSTVIPIYFGGQNSRLFQIVSHMSYTLRLALFFFETARRVGSELEMIVGTPITPEEISHFKDKSSLNRHLRQITFDLAHCLKEPKNGYPQYDKEFSFPKHLKI